MEEYQLVVDAEWNILYEKLQKLHDAGEDPRQWDIIDETMTTVAIGICDGVYSFNPIHTHDLYPFIYK